MLHGGCRRSIVVGVLGMSAVVFSACSSSPSSSAGTPAPTTAPSPTAAPTTAPGASTTAPVTTITPSTVKSSGGGTAKFCADAKVLADENTQTLKDLAVPGNAASPAYRSKYAETMLPILLNLGTDAPSDISATAKEYDSAYTEYVRVLNEVGFQIPPPDAAGRKLVEDATLAYGKVAVPDLKKLDTYVTATCGFGLNLATAG